MAVIIALSQAGKLTMSWPADGLQRWMIFDPNGEAHGPLELPAGLEIHDIGRDYVLGRWLDEDRVEYVRRYRLDRGQRQ